MNKEGIKTSSNYITKITTSTKDKIAETIENNAKEHWLAPTVENYVYGTTRALDFGDYWGTLDKKALWEHSVNKNADLFNYDELIEKDSKERERYLSFRDAAMFVNHNSHDPQLAIGLVFDATIIKSNYEDAHIVILFGVDRMKAASIARTLETYPTRIFTSMGCSIKSSICTCCGKQIVKDTDFCECLRFHRGNRFRGRKVAELLQKMSFYEQSIVTTPACSNAQVLDAVSNIIPGRILKVATEEFRNDADPIIRIMASINQSIKIASSVQEKKALINRLDALINKLETMMQVV